MADRSSSRSTLPFPRSCTNPEQRIQLAARRPGLPVRPDGLANRRENARGGGARIPSPRGTASDYACFPLWHNWCRCCRWLCVVRKSYLSFGKPLIGQKYACLKRRGCNGTLWAIESQALDMINARVCHADYQSELWFAERTANSISMNRKCSQASFLFGTRNPTRGIAVDRM